MYTPRGRGRAGRPRDAPACSPRRRARPPAAARCPRSAPGSAPRDRRAGRRAARRSPGRAGRGRGRSPARACARAAARPVRWRGSSAARSAGGTRSARTAARAGHVAGRVEAELGLEGLDVEAGRPAATRRAPRPPHGRWRAARRPAPAGPPCPRRPGRAGRSRDARRSGCDCDRRPPQPASRRRSSSISAVTARRSTPGARLQASSLSACGSIGSTVARDVGAVRPAPGLDVERRARLDVGGDVGDVDPETDPVALATGRDRVVEVARGRRVDGEGRQLDEIAARQGAGLGAPGGGCAPRSPARPGSRGGRAPRAAAPRPRRGRSSAPAPRRRAPRGLISRRRRPAVRPAPAERGRAPRRAWWRGCR